MPSILRSTIAILLSCLPITACCQSSQDPTQREWADLSGKFSVLASVDSWTAADVNLKKPSGDIATVPRAKLGKTDQAFLEAWISIEETKQAEAKVDELIEQMPSSPDASMSSLIELHRNGSNLVAGLISSVALATSTNINNLKDAERYLNATIVRLRNVQEHLPSFHKQTLVSALNDKAVIALRQGRANEAASLLVEASDIQVEISYVIYHNANLMLAIASGEGARMDLSAIQQLKLRRIIPSVAPELSGIQPPKRFLYSGQYDKTAATSPPALLPSDRQAALRMLLLWPELTCFFCSGTGVKPCPNCASGVVNVKKMEIAGYDTRGQAYIRPKNYSIKCEVCDGAAGFKCPTCDRGRLTFDN